jgi:hypothetical protein
MTNTYVSASAHKRKDVDNIVYPCNPHEVIPRPFMRPLLTMASLCKIPRATAAMTSIWFARLYSIWWVVIFGAGGVRPG